MSLFEFELRAVENIEPWGEPDNYRLSLDALSLGAFRIRAGEHVLYRYSPEILAHWNQLEPDADYQVLGFAREVLSIFAAATAPVPPRIEALAGRATIPRRESDTSKDAFYDAWRWLGERSHGTYFLVKHPQVSFVRIGDEIQMGWDNTDQMIDSIAVWSESVGTHRMPIKDYELACRDFSNRLLRSLSDRISELDDRRTRPSCPVDVPSLRAELATWTTELDGYFTRAYVPDVSWEQQEKAMHALTSR